jgi:AraC-like DNA-binding protein
MSESDLSDWGAAQFVGQLQVACGACSRIAVGPGVASTLQGAIGAVRWQSLASTEFVVARAILLSFLVKLANRCPQPANVLPSLGALASAQPAEVASVAGQALQGMPCEPISAPPTTDRRVERVLALVRERASRTVRIGDLAHEVGLSRWHLERLTKQHTGTPLRVHIAAARMAGATELLGQGSISIKEVSARLGYPHPNAFRRDFKRRFGLTPHAWVINAALRLSARTWTAAR